MTFENIEQLNFVPKKLNDIIQMKPYNYFRWLFFLFFRYKTVLVSLFFPYEFNSDIHEMRLL